MHDVQPSPVQTTTDAVDTHTPHDPQDESLPDAGATSPTVPPRPQDDAKLSDPSADTDVAVAQPPTTASAPVTPPPEPETESDTVPPLPSASDEATLRNDKSLKRKSRDSVFFASGDVTEDDPYKKAKDDPTSKLKAAEDSRPVPSTPPRAKSPNKLVSTLTSSYICSY